MVVIRDNIAINSDQLLQMFWDAFSAETTK